MQQINSHSLQKKELLLQTGIYYSKLFEQFEKIMINDNHLF